MAATGLDLGNLLVHLRADAAQFNRVIKGVTGTIKGVASTVTSAATTIVKSTVNMVTKTIKYTLGQLKRWSKWALAGIIAQLGVSVYTFMKFEEQMANVSTMLDDQTMKYMPRYAKAITRMAIEFGEGTATLSKGLYDILSASIPAADALEVLRASVIAAKAGLTDTGVAADAITTIINAYDLSAQDAVKVSDLLFAIVKKGKTNFGDLAPNIGKVAGMASVAGLSMEELGAALATMVRVLPTPIATTAARSLVMGFMKPTDDAIKVAKKFNLELNTTTLRTIGLTGVLKKLKDATAEEVAAIFPNIRGLAGFSVALKQISNNAEDLELMFNRSGLSLKAFNKMTNTLAFSWNRMKQGFIMVAKSIGRILAPSFKTLTDYTADAMLGLIDFFEKPDVIASVTKWALRIAAYINFVRKTFTDLVKGLIFNWPETWAYLKSIAVANINIVWRSFITIGKGALTTLVEIFKAFGRNILLVFEKIWADVESIFDQKKFYHDVLESRFRALTGKTRLETGEWPANLLTMRVLKAKHPREYAEAEKYAGERLAKRKAQPTFNTARYQRVLVDTFKKEVESLHGVDLTKQFARGVRTRTGLLKGEDLVKFFEEKYPQAYRRAMVKAKEAAIDIENSFSSIKWSDVWQGMVSNLDTALRLAQDEAGRVADELRLIKEEELKGIEKPKWIGDLIDARKKELEKRLKEIDEQVKKMREEGDFDFADEAGRKRKSGAAATPGGEVPTGGIQPRSLQFTAFRDAWQAMAQSIGPDETIQKAQLSHLENIDENTKRAADEGGMTE